MDVVSLHQAGITYAVATLGTATTPEHLQRIFRLVGEVVFCFDGDRAGRAAAWRALENAVGEVKQGRQVRFLFLPEGQDPDSLVQAEGAEAFEARLANALPLSDYLIRELASRSDVASVDGRAKLVELARPLVRRIPSDVYRELLVAQLAEVIRMPAGRLAELLETDDGAARLAAQRHRRAADGEARPRGGRARQPRAAGDQPAGAPPRGRRADPGRRGPRGPRPSRRAAAPRTAGAAAGGPGVEHRRPARALARATGARAPVAARVRGVPRVRCRGGGRRRSARRWNAWWPTMRSTGCRSWRRRPGPSRSRPMRSPKCRACCARLSQIRPAAGRRSRETDREPHVVLFRSFIYPLPFLRRPS